MTPTIEFRDENQILDEQFRRQIIQQMVHLPENIERKAQELRKHEVYRDLTKKWVMASIVKEGYKPVTVERMKSRATNVSISRKIVNKVATTYNGGVERSIGARVVPEPNEDGTPGVSIPNPAQISLDQLVDALCVNTKMKTADRYHTVFRNTLLGIVPVKDTNESKKAGGDRFRIAMRALPPWMYDVIPDPHDETKPAVVIITDFPERRSFMSWDERASQGYRDSSVSSSLGVQSDGIQQTIAGSQDDKGQDTALRRFIWWSGSYHFTTDINGKIIQGLSDTKNGNKNPISRLPFVNIATDQEGYWAVGGSDLTDGAILINKELTDLNFIAYAQGWGQLVIAARNPPKVLEGGPDNAFVFEKAADETTVQVEYASSNPPISQWLEMIRTHVAMLLSTYGLSSRTISTQLDAMSAASGIAMIVDTAERMENVQDSQELFRDKEPEAWEIIGSWHSLYHKSNWLVPEQQKIQPLPVGEKVTTKFQESKPPISPKEKLEELKMRKDIGLDTLVGLLRKDNPDLTEEEAIVRAKEIQSERLANAAAVIGSGGPNDANANSAGKENLQTPKRVVAEGMGDTSQGGEEQKVVEEGDEESEA